MKRFQLDEREEKILNTLVNRGAMSPSQVAAETWILPGEMRTTLQDLSDAGFVLLREDTNSPDGWLVTITNDARGFLNGSLIKK
jgi:DNA-binding MarR family transcriptional regulator